MTYTFTIREFNKESQLNLYRECLSDSEWRHKFGLLIEDLDIDNYLRSMVLTEYESVVRLLIYENSNLKGFCHVHICNPMEGCIPLHPRYMYHAPFLRMYRSESE
jgi:hypothetical protein